MTTLFNKLLWEAGMPIPGMDPAGMDPSAAGAPPAMGPAAAGAPPAIDPAAAGASPATDPAAGGTPPGQDSQTPKIDKNTPVNGEQLINAIDLMDPTRIKRYIQDMQSDVLNLPNEVKGIDSIISASDPDNPTVDLKSNDDNMLSTADIIKRYLILRKISSAAADVIKVLNSERVQNGQADDDEENDDMPKIDQPAAPAAPAAPAMQ